MFNKAVKLDTFFDDVRGNFSLLMIDYDGTLAPLTSERMKAYPYPGIEERLDRLTKLESTRIVIVSGRKLADLEVLLKTSEAIELFGSHGLERKYINGVKMSVEIDLKAIDGIDMAKKAALASKNWNLFEIKPFAVALHWRGVDDILLKEVCAETELLWKELSEQYALKVAPFDGGIELRPKGHDKGDVVKQLLAESPKEVSAAYLGDDETDEDAFCALKEKGLKVLVREKPRHTLADMMLSPPDELLTFLDKWILVLSN